MNPPAWMGSVSVGTVAVSLFVMLTLGALIWARLRPVVRSARRTDTTLQELRRDWFGVEGRPGFPPVPGVPARLYEVEKVLAELRPLIARIDKEVHPNGGGSLRDQVTRLSYEMQELRRSTEIGTLTRALDSPRTSPISGAHAEQQDTPDDDRKAG